MGKLKKHLNVNLYIFSLNFKIFFSEIKFCTSKFHVLYTAQFSLVIFVIHKLVFKFVLGPPKVCEQKY